MKETFKYKSSNGTTYELVKNFMKFGNKDSQPVYFFKKTKSINRKIHHEVYELPVGWEVTENRRNGYPIIQRKFPSNSRVIKDKYGEWVLTPIYPKRKNKK